VSLEVERLRVLETYLASRPLTERSPTPGDRRGAVGETSKLEPRLTVRTPPQPILDLLMRCIPYVRETLPGNVPSLAASREDRKQET
jgi:hypothetical protein